jgi:hypothetical protein
MNDNELKNFIIKTIKESEIILYNITPDIREIEPSSDGFRQYTDTLIRDIEIKLKLPKEVGDNNG